MPAAGYRPQSERPSVEQSRNVEYVGFHDLAGKHPFKLAIQRVKERWYLYIGLFEPGWAIVDVTDPAKPELLKIVPGPENTMTIQVSVAEGKMITGLQRRNVFVGETFAEVSTKMFGHDPSKPFEEGALIWDVCSPAEPKLLGQYRTGGIGTHRNGYYGGKYVHMSANMKGFQGQCPVTIDISDPAHPVEVGRWWYPGQWTAGGEKPNQEMGVMPDVLGFHGPATLVDNVAYCPYARYGAVVLDYSNLAKPEMIGHLSIGSFANMVGVHSFVPIPERKLAVLTTEGGNKTTNVDGSFQGEFPDNALFAALLDISNPRDPHFLSFFPTPAPEEGIGYKSFSRKPGPFGPHNPHHPQFHPDHAPIDNLVHLCYFNAGLRIFDISEPTLPREVGYFVPENPKPKRATAVPLATNFDDVLVDSRGYAFASDRNQGLFVLRYTG